MRVSGDWRRISGRVETKSRCRRRSDRKRVEGIEPSSSAWKAIALPLSYTRIDGTRRIEPHGAGASRSTRGSGECRIRTCEGKIHQIYSLTPLTARETPRVIGPDRPRASTDDVLVCLPSDVRLSSALCLSSGCPRALFACWTRPLACDRVTGWKVESRFGAGSVAGEIESAS